MRNSTWSDLELTRSRPGTDLESTRSQTRADLESPGADAEHTRSRPVAYPGPIRSRPGAGIFFFTVTVTTTVLSKDISSWRAMCDVGISLFLLFGCLYLHNFFYSFALSFHNLPSEVVCRELFP
jgi:hypothetical protein